MIKTKVKDSDNIERALKQFKYRVNTVGVLKELREREQYVKPSVKKRRQKKKAIYIQKLKDTGELIG